MRPNGIEMPAPRLDDDLSLAPSSKPLDAEALVAEFAIKRFVGTVLSGLTRVDDGGLDAGVS